MMEGQTGGQPPPFFIVEALKTFSNLWQGSVKRGERLKMNKDQAIAMQQAGLVRIIQGEVIETQCMERPQAVAERDSGDLSPRPILSVKRPRGRPRKVQNDSDY